jgi:hypothetical protein
MVWAEKPKFCPVGFPAPTDGAFLLCGLYYMKIRESGMPEESVWVILPHLAARRWIFDRGPNNAENGARGSDFDLLSRLTCRLTIGGW